MILSKDAREWLEVAFIILLGLVIAIVSIALFYEHGLWTTATWLCMWAIFVKLILIWDSVSTWRRDNQ